MDRRFVDEIDGVSEYLTVDGDEAIIERVFDVEPVIDDVAAKRSQTLGKTELGWHIGAIPVGILQDYATKRGIPNMWDLCKPEYAGELLALCQDSDYRKFSPTDGKA